MSQQGYMVISDIAGYTAYLSQSELEHAQDSLSCLLNLLIEHTEEPLVVSRLEGDAVISYSLKGSFIQGQTLVEIIEGIIRKELASGKVAETGSPQAALIGGMG